MDELEKVIISIISETIEQKKGKKIDPAQCNQKELFAELNARVLINLEHLVNLGTLHEGPTGESVYYVIN